MSHSQPSENPIGGDVLRRGPTQPALHDDVIARVLDPKNLRRAWKRVKANRGAPGIDGMRIEDFPEFARSHWAESRQQLSNGRYPPQPVRRVSIPKSGGGERLLGIRPTAAGKPSRQAPPHSTSPGRSARAWPTPPSRPK